MRRYEKSLEVRERVAAARLAVPEGLMTQVALALQQGLYYIFFPVLVIAPPFQLAVRLLIHSDFKLLLLPFKALWWLGAGFLVTVSLVWMGRSLWRWLLLLPGLLISRMCYIYQACTPRGVDASRDLKMAMCDLWPLTWLILAVPSTALGSVGSTAAATGAVVIEGEVRARQD